MHPPGALTPRAMCASCYNKWQSDIERTGGCLVCGARLEGWRLDNFYHNKREVSNRLHDGQCKEYFSLLSVKALGYPTGLREDTYGYSPAHSIPQSVHYDRQAHIPQMDYFDSEAEELMWSAMGNLQNNIQLATRNLNAAALPMPNENSMALAQVKLASFIVLLDTP